MPTLDDLKADDIALLSAAHSNPMALVRALASRSETHAIRNAIIRREILPAELRAWVASLLQEFRRGERFTHEGALCALAVAVAAIPGTFAEEFLGSLSRVGVAELILASHVAQVVLKRREDEIVHNLGTTHRLGVSPVVATPVTGDPPRLNIGGTTKSYSFAVSDAA